MAILPSSSSIPFYMDSGARGIRGPFVNTPFPDYQTAERTWVKMLEVQLEHFTKTPL